MKRAYIEITNRCNLSCAFCKKHGRNYRDMSEAEFIRIVDQVKPYTDYLYFHVQGEPFLHPLLDRFLTIADEKQCHVQLVTNGSLIEKYPHLYTHPSLRKISFSLQSIEYQNMADPMPFLHTILDFCTQAKDHGTHCEIRFWRDDQTFMPKTETCLSYLKEHFDLTQTDRKNSIRLMDHVTLSYNNSFTWPDLDDALQSHRGTCRAVDQIGILVDGTVVPCCLDCTGAIALGNVSVQDLSDILSTKRYQNMVQGFRNHTIVENLCLHCTYRLRFNR
ncbi:MAG: radical SAM/SPASM domain-containing protein [Bulleidia sp.]